jgi:Na+-transporting NADH:ubiquinone oxidoreductase subunit A
MASAQARTSRHEIHLRLRNGLDVALGGTPRQAIEPARAPRSVALIGDDYPGLRPRLLVHEGERVRLGDPLLSDRRDARIVYTAFGSGTVTAIHLGEKRRLRSLVLSLDGAQEEVLFEAHSAAALAGLPRDAVADVLLRSGLWTALRARPFGHVPLPDSTPQGVFVTAIDTHPLAPRPDVVIAERRDEFTQGLNVLGRLTDGPVFLCTAPGADIDDGGTQRVTRAAFAGPHPAGLPGTHIHALRPAGLRREVWHIGYQDVIAVGRLFRSGRLSTERVVALAGPRVRHPRLLRTRLGADLSQLTADELASGPARVISGSALSGRHAAAPVGYLGRYHLQVSVLDEPDANAGAARTLFPTAGFGRFFRRRRAAVTTARPRQSTAMFPVGAFERVMPLDVLPVPLLRALAVGDTERALELGCLELEEEDLALCSFVCPARLDYGAMLRRALTLLEKEL